MRASVTLLGVFLLLLFLVLGPLLLQRPRDEVSAHPPAIPVGSNPGKEVAGLGAASDAGHEAKAFGDREGFDQLRMAGEPSPVDCPESPSVGRDPLSGASPIPGSETVGIERDLPSGRHCRVELEVFSTQSGRAERLVRMRVSVDGRPVHVPDGALDGLIGALLGEDVRLAEFAAETYLTLSGGAETDAWQVKLTIRDDRIIERQFLTGGPPERIVRYPPPPRPLDGPHSTLPPTQPAIALIGPQPIPQGGDRHEER